MAAVPNESGTTKVADGLKQPSAAQIVTEQINSPGKTSKAKSLPEFVDFRSSADYQLWVGNGLKVCAKCGSKKSSDGYGNLVCPNDLPDCTFIKE
jgi:hypothetical protein